MRKKSPARPVVALALSVAMSCFIATAALVAAMPGASAHRGGDYTQQIYTHLSNPYLVCGNHLCGPFHVPHMPKPVRPVGSR